jgi:tetratricopeptide (TPR) repeat protein
MIALMNNGKHYDHAFGAYYAAILHILLREYEAAEAWAARACDVSVRHQFPFPASLSKCVLGYLGGQLGRLDEGLELLSEGISDLNQSGAHISVVRNMMWRADLVFRCSQFADALETVEEALQVNPEERVYVPEILRLRGEILIRQGAVAKAEGDLLQGIELAHRIGAIAWELRLAVTLARNLTARQQRAQASVILRQIKDRFVEGFSTADMRDAQALLDQLR